MPKNKDKKREEKREERTEQPTRVLPPSFVEGSEGELVWVEDEKRGFALAIPRQKYDDILKSVEPAKQWDAFLTVYTQSRKL